MSTKIKVEAAKLELKEALELAKKHRLNLKLAREEMKYANREVAYLRAELKAQREKYREELEELADAKSAERIAKAELRLKKLLEKNSAAALKRNARRAGPVTVWTPEQIAALNA